MKTRILAILFVAASVLVSCSKTEFSSGKNDSGTVPVEFRFNVDTLDHVKGYFSGNGNEFCFNFYQYLDTIYARPFYKDNEQPQERELCVLDGNKYRGNWKEWKVGTKFIFFYPTSLGRNGYVSLKNQSVDGNTQQYALKGSCSTVKIGNINEATLKPLGAVLRIRLKEYRKISINARTAEGRFVVGIDSTGAAVLAPPEATAEECSLFEAESPNDYSKDYSMVVPAGIKLSFYDGETKLKTTRDSGFTPGTWASLSIGEDVPVGKITLDYSELTFRSLTSSNTATIKATVYPSDASFKDLIWMSSDPNVAQVQNISDDSAGIKAIGNGTAFITVKSVSNQEITAECKVIVAQKVTAIVILGPVRLNPGDETIYTAFITPKNAADKSVTWTSSNPSVASIDDSGKLTAISLGETTITATANDGSKEFYRLDIIVEEKYRVEAVDLGLSVKWANANIAVTAPEQYGNHYSWGELRPDNPRHNWDWYQLGGLGYVSKYTATDGKVILEEDDDIAHKTLGGKWRMPTNEEWKELIDNCDCYWKENLEGLNVNGVIVVAANGNRIFLPAAGHVGHIMSGILSGGTNGYYWSSSLCVEDPFYAWGVAIDSNGIISRKPLDRPCGYSVRAVCDK